MMENPLSDEEGEKNGGRELNTVLTSESGMGAVDAGATVPNPEAGIWMSLILLVCFFLILFIYFSIVFVINQKTLWRKIAISLYPPITLTARWTGLLGYGF